MTYLLMARTFLSRIPWQVWCGIAVAVAFWFTYRAGYNAAADKAGREMAEYVASVEAAQAEALARAIAQKHAVERRYAELAERIDDDQTARLVDVRSATDRFIAGRVQSCPATGGSSGAVAAPDNNGAGVPATVPPGVVVDQADVRTCAALYAYAVSAHKWAKGLEIEGE